jgi:hypothetical protein
MVEINAGRGKLEPVRRASAGEVQVVTQQQSTSSIDAPSLEDKSTLIPQPKPPPKSWKSCLRLKWSRFRLHRQQVRAQCNVFVMIVLGVWILFATLSVFFRQKPFSGDYW